MNTLRSTYRPFTAALLLLLLGGSEAPATEVLGYVGPGAGLTMLGALFAVGCVLLLAVLAPILYPIRLLLAWRQRVLARRLSPIGSNQKVAGPA